jgi:hypothetical protein
MKNRHASKECVSDGSRLGFEVLYRRFGYLVEITLQVFHSSLSLHRAARVRVQPFFRNKFTKPTMGTHYASLSGGVTVLWS